MWFLLGFWHARSVRRKLCDLNKEFIDSAEQDTLDSEVTAIAMVAGGPTSI